MMFGEWGNHDHDDSVKTIHAAMDAGINFIDTANVYSAGESETIVGKALKGRRDEVVLATKFHARMGDGPNDRGNSRIHIMKAVEDSLRRLGTDHIDLYQVHRPDPHIDIEQTLAGMTDLVRQGKVRYIGSSTFSGADLVKSHWVAEHRGLERFVCEQPPYSILVRGIEREVLPVAVENGMGVIVWSPLAGGWLSGRYRKGQPVPHTGRSERSPGRFDQSLPENQRKYDVIEKLAPIAEAEGISMVQMAVAWTLEHPAVTASIIGPRNIDQLQGQLKAAEITLSEASLDAIDQVMRPGLTLNPSDDGYDPPSLDKGARRRNRNPYPSDERW